MSIKNTNEIVGVCDTCGNPFKELEYLWTTTCVNCTPSEEKEMNKTGYELNPSTAKMGMGVTVLGWSDADPYEIVKVSPSGKTLTIRKMKATRNPDWKMDWVAGGFAGHLKNQDAQEWIIESDPTGWEVRANWSNKFDRFQSKRGKIAKDHGARKYYDFNF